MKRYLVTTLAALLLAGGALGQAGVSTGAARAVAASPVATAGQVATSAVGGHTLNIKTLPVVSAAASAQAGSSRAMPLLLPGRHAGTPRAGQLPAVTPQSSSGAANARKGFGGMSDSVTICSYFGPPGCEPPDMALATSPSFVFQGVNTSFEVFNTKGGVVNGPVSAQSFFGVPNPSPSGCDPAGPFLSDPRAFYDPGDGLFWAAALQVENAFGLSPACNFQSAIWVANYNPTTGVIHSYRFDTSLSPGFTNDYTQFGFNATTVAITMNLFSQDGSAFLGAEAQFLNKQAMETGSPVTPVAFDNFTAGGVLLDGVQPVETETAAGNDPGVLYLVNSFNSPDAYGNDCITSACHGFVVWAYDPNTASLSSTIVSASAYPYLEPPNADEPGCSQCMETIDNRITGTPVFAFNGSTGLISFAHETAVNNATQVVAAVQWGQLQPTLSGHTVSSASVYQAGNLAFGSDQAASFGAVMPNAQGDLTMVFDTMSSTLDPSIMVAKRTNQDALGTLEAPTMLKEGQTVTFNSRWGDYEATSYDGPSNNDVWVASEYSGSNHDWATWIAQP